MGITVKLCRPESATSKKINFCVPLIFLLVLMNKLCLFLHLLCQHPLLFLLLRLLLSLLPHLFLSICPPCYLLPCLLHLSPLPLQNLCGLHLLCKSSAAFTSSARSLASIVTKSLLLLFLFELEEDNGNKFFWGVIFGTCLVLLIPPGQI